MAQQVIALGAVDLRVGWVGSVQIAASLLPTGSGNVYLRELAFVGDDPRFRFASVAAGGTPSDAGPDMSVAWEQSASAILFAEAGRAATIAIAGPDNATSTFRDATEPYFWIAGNAAAIQTWLVGFASGAVTLTLDDGSPDPVLTGYMQADTRMFGSVDQGLSIGGFMRASVRLFGNVSLTFVLGGIMRAATRFLADVDEGLGGRLKAGARWFATVQQAVHARGFMRAPIRGFGAVHQTLSLGGLMRAATRYIGALTVTTRRRLRVHLVLPDTHGVAGATCIVTPFNTRGSSDELTFHGDLLAPESMTAITNLNGYCELLILPSRYVPDDWQYRLQIIHADLETVATFSMPDEDVDLGTLLAAG